MSTRKMDPESAEFQRVLEAHPLVELHIDGTSQWPIIRTVMSDQYAALVASMNLAITRVRQFQLRIESMSAKNGLDLDAQVKDLLDP